MTSFKFIAYICAFVPIVLLCYHLSPRRFRWIILLAASIVFYLVNSGRLIVYFAITTVAVYVCGILLDKENKKISEECKEASKEKKKVIKEAHGRKKKLILALSVAVVFGIIGVLKYSAFINSNINVILAKLDSAILLPVNRYVLPLGISFYSMMAVSYVADVYRGTIETDYSFGRLSLYLCFFPQIMEGPMCRYGETANQLFEGRDIEYRNILRGILRILFGMMKRMLVADRVNNFVNSTFSVHGIETFDGGVLILGTLCYTFQLYMDFSGTMDIVIGSAEMFGIILPENFRRPFFSKTVSEFWTRWHITLGKWFSDYIFYPVSMSKAIKKLTLSSRKKLGNYYGPLISGALALAVVWLLNGLWHGAGWQYLFFGAYHFLIIFIGSAVHPVTDIFYKKTGIDRKSKACRILHILRTFMLVNLGEMFFRSESVGTGMRMLKKMVYDCHIPSLFTGELFKYGLELGDFILLAVFLIVLIAVSVTEERGTDIREQILVLDTWKKAAVIAVLIMIIVVFGGYGIGYTYVEPIYAKF